MADINSVNRRLLEISICALLREQGFASASKIALETLTEMLQSCKESFLGYLCVLPTRLYLIVHKKFEAILHYLKTQKSVQ